MNTAHQLVTQNMNTYEKPTLAVEPEEYSFKEDRLNEFRDTLEELNRHTVVSSIQQPEDVLLDPSSCRTMKGGYKLTTAALSQICSSLAPGLIAAISSLSGLKHCLYNDNGYRKDQAFDIYAAVDVFNKFVRTRFATCLSGKQLVRHTGEQRVDGQVGVAYRYLPNKQLFDRAADLARHSDVPAVFHEGRLSGRRMVIRYRNENPLFELPAERQTNEPFFGGFHFGNSEIGDCSVHAGALIIRQFCDNKAVGQFTESNRVLHKGGEFGRKLELLIDKTRRRISETGKLKDCALRLLNTPLAISDDETHEDRLERTAKTLSFRGVTQIFAKRAILRALNEGSFGTPLAGRGDITMQQLWKKRTEYDLFNGITAEAKDMPLAVQERAEQVGYELLIGKISLN